MSGGLWLGTLSFEIARNKYIFRVGGRVKMKTLTKIKRAFEIVKANMKSSEDIEKFIVAFYDTTKDSLLLEGLSCKRIFRMLRFKNR